MKTPDYRTLNLILIIGLILVFAISLFVGKTSFNWPVAFGFGTDLRETDFAAKIVLFEIRLPRTIIAALAGGGLALCGAVLQSYLRNPLADAGILGVSGFASLGAVIAIYFGLSALGFWTVPVAAILMGGLALLLLILLAGNGAAIMFILSGIILSALAGGFLTITLSFAPNPYALSEMIDWQIGGFSDVSLPQIALVSPLIIIGTAILLGQGRALDALSFDEATAQSLGIDIKRLRLSVIVGIGLIAGAISAVCGIISFVGLIIPHLMRPLVNNRPKLLLLPSFIFGAIFTLIADIFVRFLWLDHELKLGVIMTLLGAPFFMFLLIRLRKTGWQP